MAIDVVDIRKKNRILAFASISRFRNGTQSDPHIHALIQSKGMLFELSIDFAKCSRLTKNNAILEGDFLVKFKFTRTIVSDSIRNAVS